MITYSVDTPLPKRLAISIAQALLTGAENAPEEIECGNLYEFCAKLLEYHPEKSVGEYHFGEIGEIEDGEYGPHKSE